MLASFFSTGLLDIADQINSNVDNISTKASIPSSFVTLISAILVGYVLRFLNRQWFLIVSLFAIAIMVTLWLPNTYSVIGLALFLSVSSIASMGIDITSNSWLLAIWRGGSAHLLQGLHFTWAFGSAVGPLVMAPFLSVKTNVTVVHFNETTQLNETSFNVTQSDSHFYIPYYLVGALNAISGLIFIVLFITIRYDEREENSDSTETDSSTKYTFSKSASATVIGLALFSVCALEGAEVSTAHYMPTMIVGLGFTKTKAAYMASARGAVYTFSRVIAGYAATKLSIKIILIISFVTVVGSNVLVIIGSNLADSNPGLAEGLLWIGFSLIGLGFGPIHPGLISFNENYIKLTDFTVGLFSAVGSISVILNFYVVGHWIESEPIIMIYYVLGCMIVSLILFVILIIFVEKKSKIRQGYIDYSD